MRTPQAVVALPLPVRWAVCGSLALGAVGCAIGLVIGLHVYAPTAWVATFEIGTPAAISGALLGFVAGFARLLFFRHNDSPSR